MRQRNNSLTRVLFANNYDMSLARAGWTAGTYPAHHLYGTAGLGNEFCVIDLPLGHAGFASRVGRRFTGVGNLTQQLETGRHSRPGSVVFGAAAPDLTLLAALRSRRLFPIPVVGVFHGTGRWQSRLRDAAVRGFDHAIALSETTRQELLDLNMDSERITVVGWGPDLEFAGFADVPNALPEAPVVSTGKTQRDLLTLVQALRAVEAPARIYGHRDTIATAVDIPGDVELIAPVPRDDGHRRPATYDHTLRDMQAAAVVAVPLLDPYPLHGLTEIADALACARPVIATRTNYFDFDIEAIGCGWWVDRGDVDGWTRTLSEALSDRDRLTRMGQAGRDWARANWNATLFADGVRSALTKARLID